MSNTAERDRKSTRLNSSHGSSSYAVFCLKKKNKRVDGLILVTGLEGLLPHDTRVVDARVEDRRILELGIAVLTSPAGEACVVFFCNDTATTEIYTLSLHDALPICEPAAERVQRELRRGLLRVLLRAPRPADRKSTRLNSSHGSISYAVFCLKKKKITLSKFFFLKKRNDDKPCLH